MARLTEVMFSRKLPVELSSNLEFSFGTLPEFLNACKGADGKIVNPEFEVFADCFKEVSPLYVLLPQTFSTYPERLLDTSWNYAFLTLINPGALEDVEAKTEKDFDAYKNDLRKRISKEKNEDSRLKLESTLPFYKMEYAWAEDQFRFLKEEKVLDEIVSSICQSNVYKDTATELSNLSTILEKRKESEKNFLMASLAKLYSQKMDDMISELEDIERIGQRDKFEGYDRKLFRYYIMPKVFEKLLGNSAFKGNFFADPLLFVAENSKEIKRSKDNKGKSIDLPLLAFYFNEFLKGKTLSCKDYLILKSELRAYVRQNIVATKNYNFLGDDNAQREIAAQKIDQIFSDERIPYDEKLTILLNDPELASKGFSSANIGNKSLQFKGVEKTDVAIENYKDLVRWLRKFDFAGALFKNIKDVRELEKEREKDIALGATDLHKLQEDYYKKSILLKYLNQDISPRNREQYIFFYAIDNRHHTRWGDIIEPGQDGLDKMNDINANVILRRPPLDKFALVARREDEKTLLDDIIGDCLAEQYSQKGDDRQAIFSDPFSAFLAGYKMVKKLHSSEQADFKRNTSAGYSIREKILKRLDDLKKETFTIVDKDDKLNPKLLTLAQNKKFEEYQKNPNDPKARKELFDLIDEIVNKEFMAYGSALCMGWVDKNKLSESTQCIQRTLIIYDSEVPYRINGKEDIFPNYGLLIGSDTSQKDQDIITYFRERDDMLNRLIKEKKYEEIKLETSPEVGKRIDELVRQGVEDISLKNSDELNKEIAVQNKKPYEDPRCLDLYLYNHAKKRFEKDTKALGGLGDFVSSYINGSGTKIVYYQTNLLATRPSVFYIGKCTKAGGFDIYAVYSEDEFNAFVKKHGDKICEQYKQQMEGKGGNKK